MPTLGGVASDEGGGQQYGTSFFAGLLHYQAPFLGPSDIYATPIVPDTTIYPDGSGVNTSTLRDFTEGQDWLLKRIVGKLFLSVKQITDTTADNRPRQAVVGAGFFVGRADDANPNVPDGTQAEIDPLGSQNIRQPWIWRNVWQLTDGAAATLFLPETFTTPNNYAYGVGTENGPHIDAKSARRIRREERLWFVINAYGYRGTDDLTGPGAAYPFDGQLAFRLDYRILGAMRKSSNKSTF